MMTIDYLLPEANGEKDLPKFSECITFIFTNSVEDKT